jgi:hypothetical protein
MARGKEGLNVCAVSLLSCSIVSNFCHSDWRDQSDGEKAKNRFDCQYNERPYWPRGGKEPETSLAPNQTGFEHPFKRMFGTVLLSFSSHSAEVFSSSSLDRPCTFLRGAVQSKI